MRIAVRIMAGRCVRAGCSTRVEEIIMPDQTSRGLRFTKDRHVVCPVARL